jgi:hypothetical protein
MRVLGDRWRGALLIFALILGFSSWSSAEQRDGGSSSEGDGATTDGGVDGDAGLEESDAGRRPAPPVTPPIPADRLPSVEASLGEESVELGERVTLTIGVTAQPGDRVHLRDQRRFGELELVGQPRQREPSGDEAPSGSPRPSLIMELDLICFEVGQIEVPPIELMVVLADGRTGSVSTPTLSLRVTDPLGNENDPQVRPDHLPRPVMTTDKRALWVGGFLLALLLAAFLGAMIGHLRARAKPKPAPPPPPPRPAEEVALEKLEAIERRGWLEEGEIKTFHVAVSEALREYLGGRYHFDSLEMTTEELTARLEEVTLRGVTMTELRDFLRETDMVKFAKWRPDVERSKALLESAYDIVHRTTEAERSWEIRSSIRGNNAARQSKGSQQETLRKADRGGTDETS